MHNLLRSLLLTILILAGMSVFAQEPKTDAEQSRPLVWGLIPNYPPYSYVNEDGTVDGFVYHVISTILDELDIEYVTHMETWDTMYDKVMDPTADEAVDVYAPFVNIPERLNTVYWPDYSLITSFTTIATLQRDQFSAIEDLSDKVFVAAENDNPSRRSFESFMNNMRIPYTMYMASGTVESVEMLKTGAADGFVVDTLYALANPELFPGAIALNPRVGYWTSSISAEQWIKDIVDQVSERLHELQDDPNSYYYEAVEEHFPSLRPYDSNFPTWALLLITTLFTAVIIALLMVRVLTEKLRNNAAELASAVEQKTEELTSVYEQLVQSEKMVTLGEAVAGMAHEISTPIGVAYTASTLLRSAMNSAEEFFNVGNDAMPVIVENLRRTGNLVQTFKQITIDQTSGALRDIVLPDYINQVWHGLSQKYSSYKNISFLSSVKNENGEDISIRIATYPGALSRILINLFDNAVEHGFSPRPSKIFSKIVCDVHVRYLQDILRLTFIIEDNGVGYAVENQSKIMEPFYTTRVSDINHSGLGLSSVYRTLGKIWTLTSWKIENREGGGVKVQFSIQPKTEKEQLIKILEK